MNRLRLSLILFWLAMFSLAHAQTQRVASGRLINRTDPSVIAKGVELEVIELGSGMSILKTATTDAAGKFRIEGLPESQRLMIRASYKGANYHGSLNFDPEGKANLEMDVFEPTTSLKDIKVESVQMAFQMSGDQLRSIETYTVSNKTNPPKVYVNPEGSFRVSKAPGILEPPQMRVSAPGAEMPLVQSALESADSKSYYILYPLRPGVTTVEVQQMLPYSDRKYSYAKKFFQDCGSITIGVIPQDMALSGEGLTRMPINPEKDFAVYASAPVKSGSEVVWNFSGGTPVAEAEPAEEETGPTVTAVAGIIGRYGLVIGPLLLMGFVIVLWQAFNRTQKRSPKTESLHVRQLRERREELLNLLAEADHRFETHGIERQAYAKQREDGKRELRRITLLLKKM